VLGKKKKNTIHQFLYGEGEGSGRLETRVHLKKINPRRGEHRRGGKLKYLTAQRKAYI